MSDLLFASPPKQLRLKLIVLAVISSIVFALVSAYLGLSFIGVVGRDVPATVQVTTLGDSLGVNSSVKFRGLRVGRVLKLDNGAGKGGVYTAHVVFQRDYVDQVPRNVVARVLPGTIFGADYVDLVTPTAAGGLTPAASTNPGPITPGAVIKPDTSAPTIRLMDTFNATQRVLGALDPASMDQALSQLASALDGKGDDIRGFITRANRLLQQTGKAEPDFYADLDLIARNLRTFSDVEPALARSLRDSLPTARTIAEKARSTKTLVRASTRLTGDITTFLNRNGRALEDFLNAVVPTYEAFVHGITPFTTILKMAVAVLHNGASAIKGDAIQMKAQFNLDLVNPYTSKDCPRYGPLKGPNCP